MELLDLKLPRQIDSSARVESIQDSEFALGILFPSPIDAILADIGTNDSLTGGREFHRRRAPFAADLKNRVLFVDPRSNGLPVFVHITRANKLGAQPELLIVRQVWTSSNYSRQGGDGFDAKIRVFGNQWRHLPKADSATAKGRTKIGPKITPAEYGQIAYTKMYGSPGFDQGHSIGLVDIGDSWQGIGALGNQVKAVALAQIAALEGAFLWCFAAKVGHMKCVEIAMMILVIGPVAAGKGRAQQILSTMSLGSKE